MQCFEKVSHNLYKFFFLLLFFLKTFLTWHITWSGSHRSYNVCLVSPCPKTNTGHLLQNYSHTLTYAAYIQKTLCFSVTLSLFCLFWSVLSLTGMNKCRGVIIFVVVILAFYHIPAVLFSSRQKDLIAFICNRKSVKMDFNYMQKQNSKRPLKKCRWLLHELMMKCYLNTNTTKKKFLNHKQQSQQPKTITRHVLWTIISNYDIVSGTACCSWVFQMQIFIASGTTN